MRLDLEPGKKLLDFPPDDVSAGQASPVQANQSDQFEANIDRSEIMFALASYPIHQERLNVRFHVRQA